MFPVQSIAQSGGRRIALSVKVLAADSIPGVEIQPVKSDLSVSGLPGRAFPEKKPTSDDDAERVRQLNEKENEHYIKCSSPQRSNADGERRNAIILSGSPRQSHGRAPASTIQPGRSLDCPSWADCGERNRWHWTERGSSTQRFRCAIFSFSETGDECDEKSQLSGSRS